jgi:D-glycero-alpha-D-manno-heptose-7-phosphate kinase
MRPHTGIGKFRANARKEVFALTYIHSRAPTRIDLAGGTLDIWPLYLFHEGALTVNCAITRYARCHIEARKDRAIVLRSLDTQRSERFASFRQLANAESYGLPLLAHLVCCFKPKVGFTLTTNSEVPAGAGLGGSSAMAVAICVALDKLTHAGLSRQNWIHVSRDVEAIVLGVPTGTQDHYPPAFGGAMAVILEPGGERHEALRVNLGDLEQRLVLCYTGKPRQSGINNWKVYQEHLNGNRRIRRNLAEISAIAQALRAALEAGQWDETGRLMRNEWAFRRRNLSTISTPTIDKIISASLRAGAMAGKVCGAGGGGCVTLLIPPDARKQVERAAADAGGTVLPFSIDHRGAAATVTRAARPPE